MEVRLDLNNDTNATKKLAFSKGLHVHCMACKSFQQSSREPFDYEICVESDSQLQHQLFAQYQQK